MSEHPVIKARREYNKILRKYESIQNSSREMSFELRACLEYYEKEYGITEAMLNETAGFAV